MRERFENRNVVTQRLSTWCRGCNNNVPPRYRGFYGLRLHSSKKSTQKKWSLTTKYAPKMAYLVTVESRYSNTSQCFSHSFWKMTRKFCKWCLSRWYLLDMYNLHTQTSVMKNTMVFLSSTIIRKLHTALFEKKGKYIKRKPGPPFQVLASDVQPFQQVPKGAYPASQPHNQKAGFY